MKSSEIECAGCGEPVDYEGAERVWLKTALGISCARTHPGCEGDAARNHREQPASRISEPQTKLDKARTKGRQSGGSGEQG